MDEAQRRREEEEGNSIVVETRMGSQGRGASLGMAGGSDSWGPDDRAVDAPPPSCFGRGGFSSRLTSIIADPWTAMTWTVRIRSG